MGVVTDTAPVMGAFGRQLPDGVPHFYGVDNVLELTIDGLNSFVTTVAALQ